MALTQSGYPRPRRLILGDQLRLVSLLPMHLMVSRPWVSRLRVATGLGEDSGEPGGGGFGVGDGVDGVAPGPPEGGGAVAGVGGVDGLG